MTSGDPGVRADKKQALGMPVKRVPSARYISPRHLTVVFISATGHLTLEAGHWLPVLIRLAGVLPKRMLNKRPWNSLSTGFTFFGAAVLFPDKLISFF